MNFLAHQYLSFEDEKIRVGNFLGDFIKGRNFEGIHPTIVKGIQLHRFIDWFTDGNEIVDRAKQVFRKDIGKYSGVATDLVFDHFLAKNWKDYSRVPLLEFSIETYSIMDQHEEYFNERGKMTLFYMSKNNWLFNYARFQGIESSFIGLSKRTRYASNLEKGPAIIKRNYDELEAHFTEFFPILVGAAKKKLDEL